MCTCSPHCTLQLAHPILGALRDTDKQWLIDLLYAFNSGMCPHVCVSLCVHVYMCVHMYMCVCACVHVCTYVYVCVCMCTCVYVCICVCVHVYMHMCLCACMWQCFTVRISYTLHRQSTYVYVGVCGCMWVSQCCLSVWPHNFSLLVAGDLRQFQLLQSHCEAQVGSLLLGLFTSHLSWWTFTYS